jgi:hypothetical protein
MALFIVAIMALWGLLLIFIGPKMTSYSRRQWALLMATLFILGMPMCCYLVFVIRPSDHVGPRHVARVGAVNLLVAVPLLVLIGRRILRKK